MESSALEKELPGWLESPGILKLLMSGSHFHSDLV